MSTAIAIPETLSPTGQEWIPSRLYRLSVEQYESMVAAGVFPRGERLHLIKGYLVARITQNPPRTFSCNQASAELSRMIPTDRYHIRPAEPVRLPARASEPEPDRCVVRGSTRDFKARHPGPDDVVLLVEVADSSLADDRELAVEVYGPAGIPIYWIVNLVHRQVEVYTGPGPQGYSSCDIYAEDQAVPVVIDGQELGRVAVVDLLP